MARGLDGRQRRGVPGQGFGNGDVVPRTGPRGDEAHLRLVVPDIVPVVIEPAAVRAARVGADQVGFHRPLDRAEPITVKLPDLVGAYPGRVGAGRGSTGR